MIIYLPFPPSVNGLYSTDWKTKRRFVSKKYAAWKKEAQAALLTQKTEFFKGRVKLELHLAKPDKRRRDVANYEKSATDFLVSQGIIKDDCLIEDNRQVWDYSGDFDGCKIIIEPLEAI